MKEPNYNLVYLIQPLFKRKALRNFLIVMLVFALAPNLSFFDDRYSLLTEKSNILILSVSIFIILSILATLIIIYEKKLTIFQIEIFIVILALFICITSMYASYNIYYFKTPHNYIQSHSYLYITQITFWFVFILVKYIIARAVRKSTNNSQIKNKEDIEFDSVINNKSFSKWYIVGAIISITALFIGKYTINTFLNTHYEGFEKDIKNSMILFGISLLSQPFGLHGISKLFYMKKYKEYVEEANDSIWDAALKPYSIIERVKKNSNHSDK